MAGQPSNQFIPGVTVLEKIGVGGIATVFRGTENKNRRTVAIKMMHPQLASDNKAVMRFAREAQLLIKFHHENIVRGYQYGVAREVIHYFIMEFIDGRSLQQILDQTGPFPEDFAFSVIMQIAAALDYMEAHNIIHRDIKPDNVLVTDDGTVKLIDLGFAKPIGYAEDTGEDTTCGTPEFMSPEQAQGMKDLDVRSDIYSLGATLFAMVMGKLPFSGSDNLDVMSQQVLAELKGGDIKAKKISHHMHYFIEKMMAKDKELRFQSPAEAIEEISSLLEAQKSMEYDPDADTN